VADHFSPSDWHQWVADNGARLLLFARQQTRCEQDARDVFQEALLDAWKRGTGEPPALASVFSAVRRRAVDLARQTRSRLQRDGAWFAELPSEDWFQGPVGESVPLQGELRKIPSEYAEVVLLKIWGGLTFEQIAATLGINPSTAASRYRYGLRDLRAVLGGAEKFTEYRQP
jgi:RNA polymerase sigma-70 factor (ECF subfamily)